MDHLLGNSSVPGPEVGVGGDTRMSETWSDLKGLVRRLLESFKCEMMKTWKTPLERKE